MDKKINIELEIKASSSGFGKDKKSKEAKELSKVFSGEDFSF